MSVQFFTTISLIVYVFAEHDDDVMSLCDKGVQTGKPVTKKQK